jgi:hypothetical protein
MAAPGIVKAGVASMRVNGKPVTVMGNIVVNLGTEKRETLQSATGPVGYKAESGTPSLTFESVFDSSVDIRELYELSGIPITVTLRDGTSFAFANAWSLGEGDLESEEGKLALVFNALTAEQITA